MKFFATSMYWKFVSTAVIAIFVALAFVPPPAQGYFGDVPPGSFGADYIEFLYTNGISGGCSSDPLLYCPGNDLLRQQMATMLVRTFGLGG